MEGKCFFCNYEFESLTIRRLFIPSQKAFKSVCLRCFDKKPKTQDPIDHYFRYQEEIDTPTIFQIKKEEGRGSLRDEFDELHAKLTAQDISCGEKISTLFTITNQMKPVNCANYPCNCIKIQKAVKHQVHELLRQPGFGLDTNQLDS